MKSYVGITDFDWYTFLGGQDGIQEVNFWQPSGNRQFRALEEGELFLFKLHSPRNYIVGGGLFKYSTIAPTSLAWDSFGIGNGARSLLEMRQRAARYRKAGSLSDFHVGCILLCEPFFLPQDLWVPIPSDWKRNIVQGRTYDLQTEPGKTMLDRVRSAMSVPTWDGVEPDRYGAPRVVKPRMGQGSFRVLVTDAYMRSCSVTGERVLPTLEAAHVRPYSEGGEHSLANGLLLRSDLHKLFDQGYITIAPDRRIEVSSRIREEYDNGREYYAYHGKALRSPQKPEQLVSEMNLDWHNQHVYLG